MRKAKPFGRILLFACFIISMSGCSIYLIDKLKEGTGSCGSNSESRAAAVKEAGGEEQTMPVTRVELFPSVKPVIAGITDTMLDYSFWTSKLPDSKSLIMDEAEIRDFNAEIRRKVSKVVDLSSYKQNLSKQALNSYINEYKLPTSNKYDDFGRLISSSQLDYFLKNRNVSDIKDNNEVIYGITVKKTSIRSFPTSVGVYDTKNDKSFDRFQETSIAPCQGVIILHKSLDKKWYFIQCSNYRGWAEAENIALARSRQQVMNYINSQDFITVTGNHVSVENIDSTISELNVSYSMGDKLPIVLSGANYERYSKNYYVVKIAVKESDGFLDFREGIISKNKDVIKGVLPYTRENIIKQAFKLQGDKYDWGNKYEGRDCSSFVADIYKTFGIILPRNSQEQEESFGKAFLFSKTDSLEKRNKLLDNIKPGAVLFMPGHEMLYLGKLNGDSYIIHDFTSYGVKEGNKYITTSVFSVNVTPTTISLSSGASYLSRVTSALQIEK